MRTWSEVPDRTRTRQPRGDEGADEADAVEHPAVAVAAEVEVEQDETGHEAADVGEDARLASLVAAALDAQSLGAQAQHQRSPDPARGRR